jgi:hypothetical protein
MPRVLMRKRCSCLPLGPMAASNSPGRADMTKRAASAGWRYDHVFHEVAVARQIDDGYEQLAGFEAHVCGLDGDAALALLFKPVEDPGEGEVLLTHLFSHLLNFFESLLIDVARLV